MNAPKTRDPLAVTTRDGLSWVRRAVTQDGRGLYAPEGVCNCPEFVMATLAELAEHGIKGRDPVADAVAALGALPVPIGPDEPAVDKTHALIAAAIGEAKPARDGVLVSLAQSVKDRAEHDHSTTADWDWYCLNLSGYMGDRMGPVLRRLVDAESERDALRARVAELEAAAGDGSTRPVDEDPIAYSLTEQAGCSCESYMRCPNGHCSRHYMCQDCGNCCSCRCAGAPFVEALHASSGAVIETPPRPRPTPHNLPEVTP